MQKCNATPCTAQTTCSENKPEQTDVQAYEMISGMNRKPSAHRRAESFSRCNARQSGPEK